VPELWTLDITVTVFSKWPFWKKFVVCAAVVVALFMGLVAVLGIDGRLYERWRSMNVLRDEYRAWVLEGSPRPVPDPIKYGYASWGTSRVDSVSYMIDGHAYQGLYEFRDYTRPDHLAVTTNGAFLFLRDDGSARYLWIHKTRAAAW
jgi:hypothetical protein